MKVHRASRYAPADTIDVDLLAFINVSGMSSSRVQKVDRPVVDDASVVRFVFEKTRCSLQVQLSGRVINSGDRCL